MLTIARRIFGAAALLACCAAQGAAQDEPPPHPPGTICFTPQFWCWAQFPGQPGHYCTCPTGAGPIDGVLG